MIQIHYVINSLSELVQDGKNGVIFQNAAGLVNQLEVTDVPLVLITEINHLGRSIIAETSERVSKNAQACKSAKFVQTCSRP